MKVMYQFMENLNFTPFPIFLSSRLELRQLKEVDIKDLWVLRNDKEVGKYIGRTKESSMADVQQFFTKISDGVVANQFIYWGICLRDQRQVIGTICLWNINTDHHQCEIGYELLPTQQGKGIMSEAIKLVLDYAFTSLSFNSVHAYTNSENKKSIDLLEKHGFELLKTEGGSMIFLVDKYQV